MAATVALVRRCDFSSDISSLSLFNYEAGYTLARDGWTPATGRDGDVSVPEVITLRVEGTSHDDLADKLKALDDKIREAGWLAEKTERYGVWLRAQLPDETGARQALVLSITGEPDSPALSPPLSPGNAIQRYLAALERTPYWESIASTPSFIAPVLNCTGGLKTFSGTVPGTVPARIAQTKFYGVSGGGSGDLYEFWLGFRTDRLGTAANLATVWDLGATTGFYDTQTSVDDGTAYDDLRSQCPFAVETELKRVQQSLGSVTTNYDDQRGSYIVLLRAKVGAGTTCHVRLKDGFVYTAAMRSQPRVKVTSTDWFLHALGTVSIPPSHGILTSDFLRQYGFEIHASRTSGSGYLYLDCIILIPCAEGSLHVTGAAVKYWLGDTRPATIMMTADDKVDGWSYMDNLPRATLTVEPNEYVLPVGDVSVVLAGQRETAHDLDDYINLQLLAYKRWRTLRGDE